MSQENTFALKGVIKSIGNTQKITDRFSKKSLVLDITDNPQYPRVIEIEFTNKNIDKILGKRVGQSVSVSCEVESRPSKDGTRYFTSVRGFSITDSVGSSDGANNAQAQQASAPVADDDYPF